MYTWCKLKLLFIPLCFILLKVWGTLQFFVSVSLPRDSVLTVATDSGDVDYCVRSRLQTVFFVLGILQVHTVGDTHTHTHTALIHVHDAPHSLVCTILNGNLGDAAV